MVGRRRAPADSQHPAPDEVVGADLNEIVAYNLRRARELRGWTQEEAAAALEPLLGQRLPQASISAMERAYEGERRREFDAHELLAFALAFDLPLVWFLLPPPGDHRTLQRTSNTVGELYGLVFGRTDQLGPVLAPRSGRGPGTTTSTQRRYCSSARPTRSRAAHRGRGGRRRQGGRRCRWR